jgi:hypothetical protein
MSSRSALRRFRAMSSETYCRMRGFSFVRYEIEASANQAEVMRQKFLRRGFSRRARKFDL